MVGQEQGVKGGRGVKEERQKKAVSQQATPQWVSVAIRSNPAKTFLNKRLSVNTNVFSNVILLLLNIHLTTENLTIID